VQEGECGPLLDALAQRMLPPLLARAAARGQFAFAAPLLAMLPLLLPTPPAPGQPELPDGKGEALTQALAACQRRPELAVAAAAAAPALARCAAPHAELLQAVLGERGALAGHAGLEAYRLYARASAPLPQLVAAAIPPAMRNPGAFGKGGRGEGAAGRRCPSRIQPRPWEGAPADVALPPARPPAAETGMASAELAALLHQYFQRCPDAQAPGGGGQGLAAAWALALREEALAAAAALRRAVEACRACAKEVQAQGGQAPGGATATPLAAAVREVERGVEQLDGLLRSGGSASLDPALASTLQQCSACLMRMTTS
jgi:hypothetical protein